MAQGQSQWVLFNPSSGSSSTSVVFSTESFKGRTWRQRAILLSADSYEIEKTITVKQEGYSIYFYIMGQNYVDNNYTRSIYVQSGATSVSIPIVTNAYRIDVTQVDGGIYTMPLNIPSSFSWSLLNFPQTGTWSSTNNIIGDPGLLGIFNSNINIGFTSNNSAPRSGKLSIKCYYLSNEHTIDQYGGNINFAETSVFINQEGIEEYDVLLSILPYDGEGASTRWKIIVSGMPNGVSTSLTGSISVILNGGGFDTVECIGIVDDVNNEIILNYYKDPSSVSGDIGTTGMIGESLTSGYVLRNILS